MPPARFDAQAGTPFSASQAFVAGFGPSTLRYSKSVSGSMTPTGSVGNTHVFVFQQVSVTVYRAVARAKTLLSTFRSSQ